LLRGHLEFNRIGTVVAALGLTSNGAVVAARFVISPRIATFGLADRIRRLARHQDTNNSRKANTFARKVAFGRVRPGSAGDGPDAPCQQMLAGLRASGITMGEEDEALSL